MSRFLDFDPFSGIESYFHYIPETDKFTIEYKHRDVEPQLDASQALANDPDYTAKGMKSGWLHYAHIPDILILKWKYELGVDVYNPAHKKKVYQLLNDPEYRKLKTTHLKHEPKR